MFLNQIIDDVNNLIEDCKDKEYVCFTKGIVGYEKRLFTKKQLIEHINQNQLNDIIIFKIKDQVKLKRKLEIIEEE